MNKKRIFFGASALILSFAAGFATKASSKFSSTSAYIRASDGTCLFITNIGIFTSTAGGNKAKILTVNGTLKTLYSNATCSTSNVYFNR
jgi:hypothetical protein